MLALGVTVHIATIIVATRLGLSAAAILARTHGNGWWFAFYLVLVLAVAVHAPLGLRVIARETFAWRGPALDGAMTGIGLALLYGGWRAAWGLFA